MSTSSPSSVRVLVLLGSVLALGAGAWLLLRARDDVRAAPAQAEPPARSGPQVPSPLVSTSLPLPRPATDSIEGFISYPDGTHFPPLNGVTVAPRVVFHRLVPFSKVVGKERDPAGREWYVHENGARSTTYLDGRGVPVGDVRMATESKPVLPDEGGAGK